MTKSEIKIELYFKYLIKLTDVHHLSHREKSSIHTILGENFYLSYHHWSQIWLQTVVFKYIDWLNIVPKILRRGLIYQVSTKPDGQFKS